MVQWIVAMSAMKRKPIGFVDRSGAGTSLEKWMQSLLLLFSVSMEIVSACKYKKIRRKLQDTPNPATLTARSTDVNRSFSEASEPVAMSALLEQVSYSILILRCPIWKEKLTAQLLTEVHGEGPIVYFSFCLLSKKLISNTSLLSVCLSVFQSNRKTTKPVSSKAGRTLKKYNRNISKSFHMWNFSGTMKKLHSILFSVCKKLALIIIRWIFSVLWVLNFKLGIQTRNSDWSKYVGELQFTLETVSVKW